MHVYGLVTAEEPDAADEICDYGKTKPLYMKRCAEMAKTTSIPGMEQSIMPLREMHGLNAVGKGTQIDFDDPAKTIRMGFEVVDPAAIKKVKKGVLPCFSQGGNYAEKWADPTRKNLMRYSADPGEVSLVDRGCLPSAVIESIANKTFEFVKTDGSMQLRKFAIEPEAAAPADASNLTKKDVVEFARTFAEELKKTLAEPITKDKKTKRVGGKDLTASDFAYVGDAEDTGTWKLPIHDAAHVRNALARFNQTEMPEGAKKKAKAKIDAAAKKHGIEVSAEAEKLMHAIQYMKAATEGKPLEKGMFEVGCMAEVLDTLRWLQESSAWEREFEGDASAQPEDFATLLNDAISCFVSMVEEETRELSEHAAALAAGGKTMKTITAEQLAKAADHLTKLQGHLKAIGSLSGEAMDCCNKAMGVEVFDAAGSGPTPVEIRVGGDGTGAHTPKAAEFQLIGKTADGVEVFKRVAAAAPAAAAAAATQETKTMTNEELLKAIGEQTQRQIDEGQKMLIKAIFGSPEQLTKTDPAPGVGDRELVLPVPVRVEAVTKGADAIRPPAGAPAATDGKPTTELYRKSLTGDAEARLAFARTIKRMPAEDTNRVQSNLASFARH